MPTENFKIARKRDCDTCKRLYRVKYKKSEKGKISKKRWQSSEKCKAYAREYAKKLRSSEKGWSLKERDKKYKRSEKCKQRVRERKKTEKYLARHRAARKKSRELLVDSYIKIILKQEAGISNENITPAMIEIKRNHILIKRTIKQLNEENKYE